MTLPEATTYIATAEDAGQRLDIVATRLAGFSRSHVSNAIKAGEVLVNDALAKPSLQLEPGDRVVLRVAQPHVLEAFAQELPLDVVYEDDDVIVINKVAGMVTHPAHGAVDNTLVNALMAHVGVLPGDPIRGGLVHRLDRDTSGLLVAAKTPEALSALGKAMMSRYIARTYLGIVIGYPGEQQGTINGPIGRDPHNRMKYAIRAEGKPSVTHYAVRERLHGASELSFTLETGRTHQIRVHMAALGTPILNDPIYGRTDSRLALPGQALHAWKLAFRQPRTRIDLEFEVPPPEAYTQAYESLKVPVA